ncbi:MAG: alpha/beta fold hydrolase [Myxococcaceae bacterium]
MTFDLTPYKSLYPWQGHFLDVGQGVKLHYLDEGKGDPLVMLHGNPTWSFYWRNLVTEFSKDHRVIVPDHVGCGLSDKPGDEQYEYVLERRVADLDRLIDSLKLGDRITLVVHDWGGMIGMAWATKNPHRVKRFVVLNTAGFGLPQGRKLPWQIGVVRYAPFFPVPVRAFNAFSRGANMLCSTRPGRMTPLIQKAYLAPYDSWQHRIAVQRFVEDIPLKPGDRSWPIVNEVSEKLAQFSDVPMLICWGRKDFVFDDAFLAEWRRRLPKAEVNVFEDAGHYVLEDAHEEIIGLMRKFFGQHPLPGRDA